jgi:hypothetical protein
MTRRAQQLVYLSCLALGIAPISLAAQQVKSTTAATATTQGTLTTSTGQPTSTTTQSAQPCTVSNNTSTSQNAGSTTAGGAAGQPAASGGTMSNGACVPVQALAHQAYMSIRGTKQGQVTR